MPSRVLVHYPEPAPPEILPRPAPNAPARGEEFPPGWTVGDYDLVRGDWSGEAYDYVVWVVPHASDGCL